MQRPRAASVTTVCATAILLGACGEAGSANPPPVSASSSAAVTTVVAAVESGDGCSSDNSPTAVVAAPGPTPETAVRPESADSPLPDLAVRRINCAGGGGNLRNAIPSDRPVLVWFWAPY